MANRSKPSMRAAFTSLKHKHYRTLWFSQAASFAAMQMQMVARGLLAFQLTGSYTAVGVVMMAWGIPQLLLSLVGGAVADRVNKRNVIIIVQIGTGLLTLLTAVLITVDLISIPWLFGMGLVQGTLFAFNMPARQALLPELVPQRDLMNAIALNNVAMNSTRIIGPTVAGILIALWDVDAAYYAQSFLYLVVLGFLFRLPPSTSHLAGSAARGSVAKEIGIGLRYIGSSRTLLLLMLMAFVPTILGMPFITLLPGFAVEDLGVEAGAFGFMFTVSGIGALVGSLTIAGMTDFPRKPLLQAVAGLGFGASLVGLGLLSVPFGYIGALGALAAVGLFSTTYQTLNNTMIMTETRPEFYGRVMSVYMLTFSVFPLMSGPVGFLADRIGAVTTFTFLGTGIVVFIVLTMIFSPRYVFSRSAPRDEGEAGDAMTSVPARVASAPPSAHVPHPSAPAPVPSGPRATPALGNGFAPEPAVAAASASMAAAATLTVANSLEGRARLPRRDYIAGTVVEAPQLDYMHAAANEASSTNGASNGTNGVSRANGDSMPRPAPRRDYIAGTVVEAPRLDYMHAAANEASSTNGVPRTNGTSPPPAQAKHDGSYGFVGRGRVAVETTEMPSAVAPPATSAPAGVYGFLAADEPDAPDLELARGPAYGLLDAPVELDVARDAVPEEEPVRLSAVPSREPLALTDDELEGVEAQAAVEARLEDEPEAEDEPDIRPWRAIEAGDSVAPPEARSTAPVHDEPQAFLEDATDLEEATPLEEAPHLEPRDDASRFTARGVGGFAPSPTEHVRLPDGFGGSSFDLGRAEPPRMWIAAATASVMTGVLSLLLRGPRGS